MSFLRARLHLAGQRSDKRGNNWLDEEYAVERDRIYRLSDWMKRTL